MTCSDETERIAEDRDRLDIPEVAGSNPVSPTTVPATKESGSDQAKRPSALAGGRFVL